MTYGDISSVTEIASVEVVCNQPHRACSVRASEINHTCVFLTWVKIASYVAIGASYGVARSSRLACE